jgi:methylphosphotriester-DNA--protein-cysteine methyltransferase
LIAGFREHVGLPPKVVARILRFEHLVARLDDAGSASWSARALDGGFFDQSHLIRDFAEFAGCSPGAYLRERAVSGATAMAGPA